jgi:hypothetical protein
MVVSSHLPEAEFFLGPHPAEVAWWAHVHDPATAEDPLGAIDGLLVTYREQEASRGSLERAQDAERERFVRDARHAVETVVKPALWAVGRRLQRDGGDGFIVERAAEGRISQRITLWMSPQGPVADPPRVDRFPYLQIDVDVPSRSLKVWEGDMWNRRGASRATDPFTLETLTADGVERRAVDVLRRVVALAATPTELDP